MEGWTEVERCPQSLSLCPTPICAALRAAEPRAGHTSIGSFKHLLSPKLLFFRLEASSADGNLAHSWAGPAWPPTSKKLCSGARARGGTASALLRSPEPPQTGLSARTIPAPPGPPCPGARGRRCPLSPALWLGALPARSCSVPALPLCPTGRGSWARASPGCVRAPAASWPMGTRHRPGAAADAASRGALRGLGEAELPQGWPCRSGVWQRRGQTRRGSRDGCCLWAGLLVALGHDPPGPTPRQGHRPPPHRGVGNVRLHAPVP